MFFDSHSHLADPRISHQLDEIVQRSKSNGVRVFIQAGVNPDDWQMQKKISDIYPEIKTCFGLHPYFIAQNSLETCETAISLLKKNLTTESFLLGECGLDFRKEYLSLGKEHQIAFFKAQLEIAQNRNLPVVLHIVHADNEALQILKNFENLNGFVHSFNGNTEIMNKYLKLGLSLSIGGALLRNNNKKLHQAIIDLPLDRIFIESDTPDQLPAGLDWPFSEPRLVALIAARIAELKNIGTDELSRQIYQNGRNMFPQLAKDLTHG